ncbi:MAG: ATP-binding cassette domain-containing protein [Streptosporangiales bacterium]|nr:ATP-binding cassette domain-containing protein [Streptosporangiales bacterium]
MTTSGDHAVPALSIGHLQAWYGRAQVLFDVSLDCMPSEIVGVLGRNGAGKTSALMSAMGVGIRASGEVRLGGVDISRMPAHSRAHAGLAWVPDTRRIFANLSVRENLMLGATAGRQPVGPAIDRVVQLFPLLGSLLRKHGYALSGGEQQVVAIARALVSKPRVLLLDEPTEGLAPIVVEQLRAAIAELPGEFGVSVVMVEQNLEVALGLAGRVYVLDRGRTVHTAASDEFADSPELQNRYLAVGQ